MTKQQRTSLNVPPIKRTKRKLPQSFLKPFTEPEEENVRPPKSFKECETIYLTNKRLKVAFPFKPYASQMKYMTCLAEALLNGKHALLESPTGTGKTLCLLSVLLAWQHAISLGQISNPKCKVIVTTGGKNNGNSKTSELDQVFDDLEALLDGNDPRDTSSSAPPPPPTESVTKRGTKMGSVNFVPRIVYASRTHSQLTQVIRELKKSPYYNYVINTKRRLLKETENLDIEDLFKIRSTCLAARDHLCVHPEAQMQNLKGSLLTSWCKKQTTRKACVWHSGCDSSLKKGDLFDTEVYTNEGLKRVGLTGSSELSLRPFCPFYAAREVQKSCSIVFVPYVYIVNPSMRSRLGLDFDRDVIVVDEAHNLESTAEDAVSFEMTVHDIKSVIKAIENSGELIDATEKGEDKLTSEHCETLKDFLQPLHNLENFMSNQPLQVSPIASAENRVLIMTLSDFHARLAKMEITQSETRQKAFRQLSLALERAAFEDVDDRSEADSAQLAALADRVETFNNSQATLWNPIVLKSMQKFRVVLSEEETIAVSTKRQSVNVSEEWSVSQGQTVKNRKLYFWAFAAHAAVVDMVAGTDLANTGISLTTPSALTTPSIGVATGTGTGTTTKSSTSKSSSGSSVHSLIVTSGTLKPLDVLALQLGGSVIDFPIRLENSHVIENSQLFASVAAVGSRGSKLTMNYETLKQNRGLLDEVGTLLTDCARIVRLGGILVFFPSYALMNRCIEQWTRGAVFSAIAAYKEVFVEPQNADDATAAIEDFRTAIDEQFGRAARARRKSLGGRTGRSNGAIFFGVCRGRVSEGLSLSDDLCRLVVVIGIPYPSIGDLRIHLKKQVLSANPLQGTAARLDGGIWYGKQAAMAVNQAAGRVIRHRHDWGAILFVDARYTYRERLNELSGWIQDNIKWRNLATAQPWPAIAVKLTEFYQQHAPTLTATTTTSSNPPPTKPPPVRKQQKYTKTSYMNKYNNGSSAGGGSSYSHPSRSYTTGSRSYNKPSTAPTASTTVPITEFLKARPPTAVNVTTARSTTTSSNGTNFGTSSVSTTGTVSGATTQSRFQMARQERSETIESPEDDQCQLCCEATVMRTSCCDTVMCVQCLSQLNGKCCFCQKFGVKVH